MQPLRSSGPSRLRLAERQLSALLFHEVFGLAAGVFGAQEKLQNALEAVFHGDAKTVPVLTGNFSISPINQSVKS